MKKYILSFSGGKDSMASWLYTALELGLDVTPLFADTGHESPETYEYLDYLEHELGVPLVRVRAVKRMVAGQQKAPDGDEPLTMESLAYLKRRFPSSKMRFCTTWLKLVPMQAYLSARCWMEPLVEFVVVSGVRAEESPKRASLDPQPLYDDFMGLYRWLPIHDWSVDEVFEIHRRHGVPPNPLYMSGHGRVGCYPCILATKGELGVIAQTRPEAFDRLAAMERRVAERAPKGVATFFGPQKVSRRYRGGRDPISGKPIATAEDVRRWALGDLPRGNLFEAAGVKLPTVPAFQDEGEDPFAPSCSSVYGLCE